MTSAKNYDWVCGATRVQHKKSKKKGRLLDFTGYCPIRRCFIEWDDGGKQWIDRKKLKRL